METSLPTFLLLFHSLFTFSSFRKFIRLVVPPNGLWQNHIMTRTHSFIGFFTASYYPTNYTITHLTSSRALMSHSTYSSVLLLTYFLGLILLKGAVYKCLVGRPRRYKKQRKEFLQLFSVPQGIVFERPCCVWTSKEKCSLDSMASTYMYDGLGLEDNRRKTHGPKRSQRLATAKDSCSEYPKRATPKSHPTRRTADTTKFICPLSTEQIRHAQ